MCVCDVLVHLEKISGIDEWHQIRQRRRRALLPELAMCYLTGSRLAHGTLQYPEALLQHRFDMEMMERETHIISYASKFLAEPHKAGYITETDRLRQIFFTEDRTLNMAVAERAVNLHRLSGGS